ncbi:MAG: hypothetical protein JST93_36115 [Acidobacteria bacterium]|nr:hypothetical protein [Acidobacteriota bacterium]
MTILLLLNIIAAPAWSTSPQPFAFGAVRFEANQGQADSAALYFARARGQHLYFMEREIVFDASGGTPVRMSFAGANKARWTPVGAAVDRISYYLGNDPSRWVKDAPVYSRLAWRNVYPGIDAVFYDRGGHVEYDLVLAPGADPSRIRLRFSGASRIESAANGDIEIKAGAATLRQHAPEIYQQDQHGKRHRISGRFYATTNGEFHLQLGAYQKTRPLIVDPVLEASTYWGGENDDEIVAVSEYFVAGNTRSAGLPNTTGARRRTRDIFLTGLGRFGNTTLLGTVILGGSGDEELAGVILTGTNGPAAYLAGTTNSRDFATNFPALYRGGASDGFLLELFNQSSFSPPSLRSFRYVGGSGRDRIHAIAPYSFGAGLLAGSTDSPDLDTARGGQRSLGGGTDAFFGVLQFGADPTLSYLGGSGDDEAFAIQQDFTTSAIFIAGQTRSTDFPQATTALRGPSDAFLTQVRGPSPRLTDPSTFETMSTHLIGGSGEDSIRALARLTSSQFQFQPLIPRFGLAGTTTSPDLPVRNAAQSALGGDSDAFAGVWVPESSSFQWLTYLGGAAADAATSAAFSTNGDLALGGWTQSTDLPVIDALQPKTGGAQDGLFALFDDVGAPRQLTYFGGSGDDRIDSVAFLTNGATRVGGSTTSTNLPLRSAAQPDYAARSDGFYADIGADFLSGPSEIILPKDAARTLILRPARNTVSPPVTFRTSDPSRLRFTLAGRSFSELTSPAEIGVRLEALSDSGEVEITASSAGFASKTIRVKLYPAVLVLRGGDVSTWSPDAGASLTMRAIDPATGQFIGDAFYDLRQGVIPAIQWTSSNPSVLEVSRPSAFSALSVDLIIRGPGQSRISAVAPGWRVIETESALITVSRPEIIPPSNPIRLGQYLQNAMSIQFAANGLPLNSSSIQGTLTVRSEDPSRLLLSTSPNIRGSSQLTVALNRQSPIIYAQALASSGEVRVIFTSPDFAGEHYIPITLEPCVLRWGARALVNGVFQFTPELKITQGSGNFGLAMSLEGESGAFNAGQVPGTPPVTLKFSNSDPSILSLSRLTADLTNRRIETVGLRPGTSQLSLSVSPDTVRLEYSSITVTVTPGSGITTDPKALVIGKDLQTSLFIRGAPPEAAISLSSSDPTAVLFSTSPQASGTPALIVPASANVGNSFVVQSLKDQGETTIRIRVPGQPDIDVPVTHVASGILLSAAINSAGVIVELSVSTAPLDEVTATPLPPQGLRPGVTADVRLRTEGSPITLTPSSVLLTNAATSARVSFTPLPPGAETLITAEAAGFPLSARRSIRLRGTDAPPALNNLPSSIYLTRDTLRNLDFFSNLEVTATSSDPAKFLIATSRTAAPSASVRIPPGIGSFLVLHALTDTGNAILRIEPTGRPIQEVQIAFVPLVLTFDQPQIPVGQSRELFTRSIFSLRPGAGPFRFSLRSTDPSIATVSPDSIEWNTAIANLPPLRITAVAPGRTTITAEGPESVYFTPIEVIVPSPSIASAPLELHLGRSTQVSYAHSFQESFPNGAIVSVTSSDPARLLLSRTAATPGAATTTVSIQPGDSRTQPLYLQAQASEGDVTLRFQNADGTVQTAIVHIVNSWISCESNSTSTIGIPAGSTTRVACRLRSAMPSNSLSEGPQLLPGASPIALRLRSSDPAVFTVSPESAPFNPGQESFALRGIAPGTATLLIDQPDGFGPAPDAPLVTVTLPTLTTGCLAITLGPDTQRTCEINVPAGVSLTAESSHPALTLVSNNATEPGSAQVPLTAPRVTIQQLARFGTAEITIRAAGYADLIIPVVGGETQMRLNQLSSTTPFTGSSVRVGTSFPVTLQLSGAARAGSRIFAAINATPTGIIAIDPASVVFSADQTAAFLNIRGAAPGSAIISISAPAGVSVSATPVVVSVTP